MSYTESDVIENIFKGIKNDLGLSNVINLLIGWYEHEIEYFEVNEWDTKPFEDKIKLLKKR